MLTGQRGKGRRFHKEGAARWMSQWYREPGEYEAQVQKAREGAGDAWQARLSRPLLVVKDFGLYIENSGSYGRI